MDTINDGSGINGFFQQLKNAINKLNPTITFIQF